MDNFYVYYSTLDTQEEVRAKLIKNMYNGMEGDVYHLIRMMNIDHLCVISLSEYIWNKPELISSSESLDELKKHIPGHIKNIEDIFSQHKKQNTYLYDFLRLPGLKHGCVP